MDELSKFVQQYPLSHSESYFVCIVEIIILQYYQTTDLHLYLYCMPIHSTSHPESFFWFGVKPSPLHKKTFLLNFYSCIRKFLNFNLLKALVDTFAGAAVCSHYAHRKKWEKGKEGCCHSPEKTWTFFFIFAQTLNLKKFLFSCAHDTKSLNNCG